MKEKKPIIASMEELLAHARALELESAECYQDLADSMVVHNNPEAAALFDELARDGKAGAAELARRTGDLALPQLAHWEYHWAGDGGPANCMERAHYLMTAYQALELVLHNEEASLGFYLQAVRGCADPQVQTLARELAQDKQRQVALLRVRLVREARGHAPVPEDLDPPNTPE